MLDEPTQSLDVGRQLELLGLIRTLNGEGVTILAAMHDLQLIEGTFSSVLLLDPEQKLRKGRPQDILQPDILERAFDCPPRHHPKQVGEDRAFAGENTMTTITRCSLAELIAEICCRLTPNSFAAGARTSRPADQTTGQSRPPGGHRLATCRYAKRRRGLAAE